MRIGFVLLLLCSFTILKAQRLRWHLTPKGGIEWVVAQDQLPHTDHIEMSGKQVSVIITYGTDSMHNLVLKKEIVFPMLRTIPNDTHASLVRQLNEGARPHLIVNGKRLAEKPGTFSFDGVLTIHTVAEDGISITKEIFPSTEKAALVENCTVKNGSKKVVNIAVKDFVHIDTTDANKGVYGAYIIKTETYGAGEMVLQPGEQYAYAIVSSGRKLTDQPYYFSASYEKIKRQKLVEEWMHSLVLQTPNDTLNKMFAFAKIRASESIYDTKNGLMHGPGGGTYYAAIWANDQAEYVNPFFPFLGYAEGNESAVNSFRLFANYMNAQYKPIPSSIIAEGTDVWNGAGDRGDQAMIAYGAARFALEYADTIEARKLWTLIDWCLTYLGKKKTVEGVIASDADELEGRFPAGKVNLSTNVLAYGAMVSAAHLAKALDKYNTADSLNKEAAQLRTNIDKYFGGNVQGFNTYRYYKGNTTLRSWIGLPLVMGMFERKGETMRALFSPFLWTKNGMLTEAGSATYWDRALLYAMRGLLYAGATDTTLKYLNYYSSNRLLGEHVPYAIEAWPEGGQRHLSAESGLYCRTITEGLFGLQPTGFNSFTIQPFLPAGWHEMSLNHIKAFNNDFDINVSKEADKTRILITEKSGKKQEILWDGIKPVEVIL